MARADWETARAAVDGFLDVQCRPGEAVIATDTEPAVLEIEFSYLRAWP
ncbi:MAG: hypothetical protein K2X97_01235 [Mycobacteriaceae bacterium]|nr:hypothetical protein [Mycobacteriaceae bacterium]